MCDPIPQILRLKRAIARMLVEYQNRGIYLDLDGNLCRNTEGIVNAWIELDKLEG